MPIYGVPRDSPPHGLSSKTMVLDNSTYVMGSFDAYVDTSRDYFTWFVESSVGPIIGDIPVNGGRVLGSIICAQVATMEKWRVRAEALKAKVTELEALFATREAHMQEETTWALAREREI